MARLAQTIRSRLRPPYVSLPPRAAGISVIGGCTYYVNVQFFSNGTPMFTPSGAPLPNPAGGGNCAVVPTEKDTFTNADGAGEGACYQRPSGSFLMVVDGGSGKQELWDVSGAAAVSHSTLLPSNPDIMFSGGAIDYSVQTAEWVEVLQDSGTQAASLYLFGLVPVTHLVIQNFRVSLGTNETCHQVICDDTTGIAYLLFDKHIVAFNVVTRTVVTTLNINNPHTITADFVIPAANGTTPVSVQVNDSSYFAVNETITPNRTSFGLFRVAAIIDPTHISLVYPAIAFNTFTGSTVPNTAVFGTTYAGNSVFTASNRVSFGYDPTTQRLYVGRSTDSVVSADCYSTLLDIYHGSALTKVGNSALITTVLPFLDAFNAGCVFNPTDGFVYYVETNNTVGMADTIIHRLNASTGAIIATLTLSAVSIDAGILFNNGSQQIYLWTVDNATSDFTLTLICAFSLATVTTYNLTILGLGSGQDIGQKNLDLVNNRFYIPYFSDTKAYGF